MSIASDSADTSEPLPIISKCLVCEGRPSFLIELPGFPVSDLASDSILEVIEVDNILFVCERCRFLWLGRQLPSHMLYGSNYGYSSTASLANTELMAGFAAFIKHNSARFQEFGQVIDIGSSDSDWIHRHFDPQTKVVAVDPSSNLLGVDDSARAAASSITRLRATFESIDLAAELESCPTLFVSSHNLEHLPNPRLFFERISEFLAISGGEIALQLPNNDVLINLQRLYQIFPHHYAYYSDQALRRLATAANLEVVAFERTLDGWGTMRMLLRRRRSGERYAVPDNWSEKTFVNLVQEARDKFVKMCDDVRRSLEALKASGQEFGIFGASLSLPILNYHLGGMLSECVALVDDADGKAGKYLPGISVPVTPFLSSPRKEVSAWFLGAPQFRAELTRNLMSRTHLPLDRMICLPGGA